MLAVSPTAGIDVNEPLSASWHELCRLVFVVYGPVACLDSTIDKVEGLTPAKPTFDEVASVNGRERVVSEAWRMVVR